jgi:hypothetical protein
LIERISGKYYLSCDSCGKKLNEGFEEFKEYDEVESAAISSLWILDIEHSAYRDLCPTCSKKRGVAQ